MDDYDYNYSDSGETSDDMCIRRFPSEHTLRSLACMPEEIVEKTMEDHIRSIDLNVAAFSVVNGISFPNDDDFEDFTFGTESRVRFESQIPFVESVVIDLMHVSLYQNKNIPVKNKPYLAWISQESSSANDLSSLIHSFYKNKYQEIYHALRFSHLVSPTKENFKALSTIRREFYNQVILFHYIGFGYPNPENGSLYYFDYHKRKLYPYPIKNLMMEIQKPSFFIFDCNNAASLLSAILNENKLIGETYQNDIYVLCATDVSEVLPSDPHLPRDFLTSCLLTPICISVLCHILQYYRTSFPFEEFPMEYLKSIIKESDELKKILMIILESIASDYLKDELFQKLFRNDKVVSSMFRNFILAQYLLEPYNVKPASLPKIPNMSKHPLWVQWQSTLDSWISSNLTKSNPLSDYLFSFYSRSIDSFQFLIEKDQTNLIKASLLTIVTQTPNVSFSSIAKYISKNSKNQIKLATIFNFNPFFIKLFQPVNDKDEYKSLCLIILSMLNLNPSLIMQTKKEINVSQLYQKAFDETLDDETKTLISAIIYQILPSFNSLKSLISDEKFFNNLKNYITKSSAQHLQWLIFLISRCFKDSFVERFMFYESSVHFQLCELIYHKSCYLRAIVLNSLFYFLQNNDETTNYCILLMSIPSFMDASYLVRYQLLLFLSNFLSENIEQFIYFYNKYPKIISYLSFSELLSSWLNFNVSFTNIEIVFTNYLKNIDKQIHSDNFLTFIYNSVFSIIDYFTHDPFPKINQHAKKIKNYFLKLIQEKQASDDDSKSSSLNKFSSPSNSLIQSNELCINNNNLSNKAFEDDSNIDKILTKNTIINFNKTKQAFKKSQNLQKFGNIDISSMNLNLKVSVQLESKPTKIGFESSNLFTAVSMVNNTINYYDENLVLLNSIKTDGGEISDLHILEYNQDNFVISCTSKGCLNIWNPTNKYCSASFRVDSNCYCDSIQQFAAVSSNHSNIATIRGNCALALWDIESQKLIGEWNGSERNISTSLIFHPNDKNRVFIGYSNGCIIEIDTRISSMNKSNKFNSISLGEKIVNMGINKNGGDFVFTASNSKCSMINTKTTKSFSNILSFQTPIVYFDVHSTLPLMALTRQKDFLSIYNSKGQLLRQIKNIGCDGIYKFHSVLPVLNVATNNELSLYNFTNF